MNKPLKIAVIGAGYMGQNHVKILSSIGDVELVAVCDIDKTKTSKLAKQYKLRPFENYEALLEFIDIDAVSICLPTNLHFESASYFIKKRLPIFLEKPISEKVIEAKKIVILAKKYKTPVMIGHIERFNPVVNEIKQRIASGELGNIFKIHTQRLSPPRIGDQNVSVVVDLATHDIDVMLYLTGQSPTKIFAQTSSYFHKKEDLVSAVLNFNNNFFGIVEASWLHPTKTRSLSILGENGFYLANYLTQELFFYKQNKQLFNNSYDPFSAVTKADVVKIAFQSQEPLYLELKAFVESLLNNKPMPVSEIDGLRALEIAYKIIRAGTRGKIISK